MLQTMQSLGSFWKMSAVMMSLQPVVVTIMLALGAAFSTVVTSKPSHSRLQCIDWVNFGDYNSATKCFKRLNRAFAHISVTSNQD
uniref:Uncharacterized protein n=1 Tax=Ciona savignyi TaxID=51511 RepID=H2YCY4_CIOSA